MGGCRGIMGEKEVRVVKEHVERIHGQSQRREGSSGGGAVGRGVKMETTVLEQH